MLISVWYDKAYASQRLEEFKCKGSELTPQEVEDELFRILDQLPEKEAKKELKEVRARIETRLGV